VRPFLSLGQFSRKHSVGFSSVNRSLASIAGSLSAVPSRVGMPFAKQRQLLTGKVAGSQTVAISDQQAPRNQTPLPVSVPSS
jgi:hypothetical protein